MKKSALLLIVPALMALVVGCKNKNGGESSSELSSSISIDETLDITVNFYIDFNNTHYKSRYYQTTVKNGSLITDIPANPSAPSSDFPVFKGWSEKEVTDDYAKDIWDFSVKKVQQESNSPTLNLYGIWAAQ